MNPECDVCVEIQLISFFALGAACVFYLFFDIKSI